MIKCAATLQILVYTVFAFGVFGFSGIAPAVFAADQMITLAAEPANPEAGDNVAISIFYDVSDNDNKLGGIGLRVHYNSLKISYMNYDSLFPASDLPVMVQDVPESALVDFDVDDGDPETDRVVQFAFVDFEGNWPGEAEELPLQLINLNFSVNELETTLYTTGISNAPGYKMVLDELTLFKKEGCSCDINEDGEVTPVDALCAFQKYLDICPTDCGDCVDVCCDVNDDEDCTPADALEIFKEYLGIMPNACSEVP